MPRKNTKRTTKQKAQKRDRSQTITIDLAAGQRRHEKQADLILALLNSPINNFLREAIVEALAEAARRSGHSHLAPTLKNGKVVVSENSNPHFQDLRRNLANLLCFTFQKDFTLRLSERAELAHAISTVLKSRLTPPRLEQVVGDFITDTTNSMLHEWQNSPETVERVLASGQCGYGSCEGTNDESICGALP